MQSSAFFLHFQVSYFPILYMFNQGFPPPPPPPKNIFFIFLCLSHHTEDVEVTISEKPSPYEKANWISKVTLWSVLQ